MFSGEKNLPCNRHPCHSRPLPSHKSDDDDVDDDDGGDDDYDDDDDDDDDDDKVVGYSPSPKNKVKVLAANFFDEICRRPGTEKTLARQPFQHIN